MANEVLIGTNVPNSPSNFLISKTDNPTVSGKHAKVFRGNDGKLYIEDLGSTNGTYVNNHKIKRSPISSGMTIKLGSNYILPLEQHIIPKLPIGDDEFNHRMNMLKHIWDNHQETVRELNLQKQKVGSRRMLPMMIGGVFGAFAPLAQFLIGENNKEGISPITIISAVISVMGFTGYFIMGNIITNKMREIDENIAEENEKFQLEYECPSCHRRLGATPWRVIAHSCACPCCNRPFTPRG